jgi:hypothetical protein
MTVHAPSIFQVKIIRLYKIRTHRILTFQRRSLAA